MIPLHDDNPSRITPWVNYGLMAACIFVFIWELGLGEDSEQKIYALGFIPAVFFDKAAPTFDSSLPASLTLITSQFVHGGILHLAGNMLYLWIFGNNIEEAVGHGRFFVFYLLCGIAAALGQGLVNPDSLVPMVGASGAISGVLGAYLLLFPRTRVLVVIPLGFILYPTRLTAIWVLGSWFAIQAVMALISNPGTPGIAWWAHFAGFVAGAALVIVMRRPGFPLFGPARVLPKGPWARALIERGRDVDDPRGRL